MYCYIIFFFFNDTATTEIYTLSLHDALPICSALRPEHIPYPGYPQVFNAIQGGDLQLSMLPPALAMARSEEHTSELQSQSNLVCRLLLEKKKKRYLPYDSQS